MSTTYTTNYHLGKQTDTSDNFDMSVITDNMDIIDTQMKSNETNISLVNEQMENFQDIFEGTIPPNETSQDLTDSITDGYYYSYLNVKTSMSSMCYAEADIEGGKEYIVKVWILGAVNKNIGLFYDINGDVVGRIGTDGVGYTVIDESKKIIKVTSPADAIFFRYNGLIAEKADMFIKQIETYSNIEYSWLKINRNNLDNDLKNSLRDRPKYGMSLKKPFDFANKTINFYGDSITYGTVSDKATQDISPNSGNSHSWANKFAGFLGLSSSDFRNRAVAGTYICDTTSENSILNKILNESVARDYMIIAGGTNDWTYGKPLGRLGDTQPTTFYGALDTICQKCTSDFPNSTVIFITPINQNVERTTSIASINAYRNAIFEVGTIYGFNVVDGSQIGFPLEHDAFALEMCADGVHPTEIGHTFYAKSMCGILL